MVKKINLPFYFAKFLDALIVSFVENCGLVPEYQLFARVFGLDVASIGRQGSCVMIEEDGGDGGRRRRG